MLAEYESIRHFFDSDKVGEIARQDVFSFEDYEDRFNEILNQGYFWVNLSFTGIFDGRLLVVIELPGYENNVEATSINLSLPEKIVVENDWNISSFIKII